MIESRKFCGVCKVDTGKVEMVWQYGWQCPNCNARRRDNQFADLSDLMKEAKAAELKEAMRVISENSKDTR